MSMPPFDPDNNTADGLYVQIRDAGDLVKAYNLQIAELQQSIDTLTAARDAKVAEMVTLRSSITVELVGFPVP